MQYIVSAGVGVLIFLLFHGFAVVSGIGEQAEASRGRYVYIEGNQNSELLKNEIERLRTLASIREVLEVYYKTASIEDKREVAEAIVDACRLFDLRVELVLAVIKTESSFRAGAVSVRGAQGLMQLMPRTGLAMSKELDVYTAGEVRMFDMRTNIMLGCYYLKKMLDRYENLDHALLAYNTGPTRFDLLLASKEQLSGRYSNVVQKNMMVLAENFFSQEFSEQN